MKKFNPILITFALYFSAILPANASIAGDLQLWLCDLSNSKGCATALSTKGGTKIGKPD